MLSHSVPSPRSQMKADCRPPVPTQANHDPASPPAVPPWSWLYKQIVGCFVPFAALTILGLLMVIFLVIPAGMQPELGLIPGSSLSSLNISTSHVTAQSHIALSVKNPCKLIAVKYAHMKLLLSFQGQLAPSRPSLVPAFTHDPGNVTTVQAESLSTVAIANDLGVKGLVSTLKGPEVTIDIVAKAKRRLQLGPWWVPVLDAYISCMDVTFTAPADSEAGSDWMILGGTLSCTPDIFTQF